MKIALKDLEAAAAHRPPGYLSEVMAAGKVVGDMLVIQAHKYTRIFAKYRDGEQPFEQSIARAVDNYKATCPTC